jgi:hypothetical protein
MSGWIKRTILGRWRGVWFFGAVLVAGLLWYRLTIPYGLGGVENIVPYLMFSEDREVSVSPDGEIVLRVRVYDGGATDGGNRPTDIIREQWWGDKVVVSGYLYDLAQDIELTWTGPRTFTINFVRGKRDTTPAPRTVTLK